MFTKTSVVFKYCLVLGIFLSASAPLYAKQSKLLEAEKKLATLGYWLTKADGKADASTRHAIMAFQKVEGLKRTGVLNNSVLERLRAASRPAPRYKGEAHIEVDITRQVLFVVDENAKVTHVLPVSTGNGEKYFDQGKWQVAITPRGAFNVERKINGVRKASLGDLYYPSYFSGGIAIHGSNSIPATPDSHGCVRIPRFADKALFEMAPVGMLIFVYD